MQVGNKYFRKFAVKLLNDEDGINKDAYEMLSVMLVESENDDLLMAVDMTEDKAYIGEDFADEELERLANEEDEEDEEVEEIPTE